MSATVARHDGESSKKAVVLAKATLRAAQIMGVNGTTLSEIIGVSPSTISRSKDQPEKLLSDKKTYELAAMFVRLYRGLDSVTGGDDKTSQNWLKNENTALSGKPIEIIQSIEGLMRTVMYVDTRRAKI